jgi:hypothetical protein
MERLRQFTTANDNNTLVLAEQRAATIANTIGINLINEDNMVNGDAAGRRQVVEPTTLYDFQHEYDQQPVTEETLATGSGNTATHNANEAAVDMTTGGTATGRVVRQSRQYIRYQPGRAQLILCTGVMGAATENITQRIGYYDDNNGVFFEQTATDVAVVVRSNTSGSVVDTRVAQASWNQDVLDGTGPSGVTLDLTKNQVFVIDFLWLGTAQVRYGFYLESNTGDFGLKWAHEAYYTNTQTVSFMRTANLPVRYELVNDTTPVAFTMKEICSSVISWGGFESDRALPFAASNQATSVSCGTGALTGTLAIRAADTFNSLVNRAGIRPRGLNLFTESSGIYWQLVYNPTVTGGAWVSADANSAVEYNATLTSFSGGIVIEMGYLPVGGGNQDIAQFVQDIASRLPYGLDAAATAGSGTTLLIAAQGLGGTADVYSALMWDEIK